MPITTIAIQKTSTEDSGLFLYKDDKGRIIINDIQRGGIFENTDLQSSLQIISVNGVSCNDLGDADVKAMIDEAHGEVIIEVQEIIYDAIIVDGAVVEDNYDDNVALTATAVDIDQPFQTEQIHQNLIYRGGETDLNVNEMFDLPPEGLPEGGHWATIKYNGTRTMMLCFWLACCTGIFSCCGICAFLCPMDRRNVYIVNDRVCSF